MKKKSKPKIHKYRFKDGLIKKYPNEDVLLSYLKKAVERGDMIGSTANVFMKTSGFCIYRVAEVHLLNKEMTEEEMKSLMSRIDSKVVEIKDEMKSSIIKPSEKEIELRRERAAKKFNEAEIVKEEWEG